MKKSFDDLDTEFYIERAYELRRAYISSAVKSLFARIKVALTFDKRTTTPLQGNPAH